MYTYTKKKTFSILPVYLIGVFLMCLIPTLYLRSINRLLLDENLEIPAQGPTPFNIG